MVPLVTTSTTRIMMLLSCFGTCLSFSANYCTNRPNRRYQDPNNCRKYFECEYQNLYHHDCGQGMKWDQSSHVCITDVGDQCDQTLQSTPSVMGSCLGTFGRDYCLNRPDRKYPDPNNCRKYYECRHREIYHNDCGEGMKWNQRSYSCIDDTESRCANTLPTPRHSPQLQSTCPRIVCYYNKAAQWRTQYLDPPLLPGDIPAYYCTHIILAFFNISGGVLLANDNGDLYCLNSLRHLKTSYPDLKTLVSVGGEEHDSSLFSEMALTYLNRSIFINSTLEFLREHELNGLDLAWMHPTRGGRTKDRPNFTKLCRQLKEAFIPHGYLLSTSVTGRMGEANKAYDIAEFTKHVDFINLMAWDYYTSDDQNKEKIYHHSALFRPASGDGKFLQHVDDSVEDFLKCGTPRSKLVLGIPFHARTYTLNTTRLRMYLQNSTTIKLQQTGPGISGFSTENPGMLTFYEFCDIKNKNEARVLKEGGSETLGFYLIYADQWIGYEHRDSVRRKAEYSRNRSLGGVAVWDLSLDDYQAEYCNADWYSLLRYVNTGCNVTRGGGEEDEQEEEEEEEEAPIIRDYE